jgi:hypothetical protein
LGAGPGQPAGSSAELGLAGDPSASKTSAAKPVSQGNQAAASQSKLGASQSKLGASQSKLGASQSKLGASQSKLGLASPPQSQPAAAKPAALKNAAASPAAKPPPEGKTGGPAKPPGNTPPASTPPGTGPAIESAAPLLSAPLDDLLAMANLPATETPLQPLGAGQSLGAAKKPAAKKGPSYWDSTWFLIGFGTLLALVLIGATALYRWLFV